MRRLIVSLVMVLALLGVGLYLWTAPPRPLSETVGAHEIGSTELRLKSVRAFAPGDAVVIDANPNGTIGSVVRIDAKQRALILEEPLPFAITEETPASAVRPEAAELLVAIEIGTKLRRFPRGDSLTIATAPPDTHRPFLRQIDDWVKIELKPGSEAGWAPADKVVSVSKGLVDEVIFRQRIPVRSEPYPHEELILWEGRILSKSGDSEGKGYAVNIRNLSTRQDKVHELSRSDWEYYKVDDYVVYRKEKGLTRIDSPRGFTRPGIPYEASERDGGWIKINLQTQAHAWLKRESCTFVAEYQYNVPRRSLLGSYLRRLFGSP